MPIAKKPAASKKEQVAEHKHDDLIKQIADLKKELAAVKAEAAAVKGQCHSCCGDVADLKSKVADLELKDAGQSSGGDVDKLIKLITHHLEYRSLRAALKKAGYKL